MKSILKLTYGELVKVFKGIGVYIMTGILIIAIVLFAILYETHVEGTSLLSNLINRDITVTVFDVMDGEADEIVGDNFGSAMEIPGAEDLLDADGKFNDYFKMILLTDSLNELIVAMSDGDVGVVPTDPDPDPDPDVVPTIPDDMFGLLKTASMIGGTFQADLANAKAVSGRVSSEIDYFYNNGAYGKTYIDYIEQLFIDFAKEWNEFTIAQSAMKSNPMYTTALGVYAQAKEIGMVERSGAYIYLLSVLQPLIEDSIELMNSFAAIKDYTTISMLSTKYLLYKAEGMFGVETAGRELTEMLTRFETKSANYNSLLESYNTMLSDTAILLNALPDMFANEQEALFTCVYRDFTRAENKEPAIIDLEKFMVEVDGLISNQTWAEQFFSGFNTDVPNPILPSDFDTETEYYSAVMERPITRLRASLGAVITEDVHGTHIAPYKYVLDECDELYTEITELVAEYRGLSSAEKEARATDMYASVKRAYQVYMSKVSTFNALLQNLNLSNTVEVLGYKDSQLSKIYGNQLFGTKYSIRATVTECKFFLETGEVGIDYVNAITLDAGYGYMNFSWVIVYVLILIFGIVIGAGQIAGEHSQGTMKLLLIRPHHRWQVILSKLIATMVVTLAFLVFALLITFLIGGVFWGFSGTTALLIFNSTSPIMVHPFVAMTLAYLFGYAEIFVYVLIALMVSTVFKSHAGAVSVSMLIYFLAMVLTTLLGQYNWYKFVVFNNSNLYQYFSVGPSLNDMTFWFSFVVNIVYITLLMFASLFTFQKRDAV